MNDPELKIFTREFEVKIMPGVTFPARSTFIELADNQLLIVSPGPFVKSDIESIVEQYDNVFCVAPNAFHHMYLEMFHNWFPRIEIFGNSLVKTKQPWVKDTLQPIEELQKKLQGKLDLIRIEGNPSLRETVFYHPENKTLVVTDLFFFMKEPMPFGRRFILKLFRAYGKPAQSGLVKMTTKDKTAYKKSIEKLKELDCQKLIMAHGHILDDAAEIKSVLARL
jgi:hypothetical protein